MSDFITLEEFCDRIYPEDLEKAVPMLQGTPKKLQKKAVAIEELLGMAIGSVGMSYVDFCALTPSEFGAVWKAHTESAEGQMRQDWERTRTLAVFGLQPWSKKKLTPKDVMKFPWDDEPGRENKKEPPTASTPERFMELPKKEVKGYRRGPLPGHHL